jgi:hypothetical protein
MSIPFYARSNISEYYAATGSFWAADLRSVDPCR